MNIKLKSKGADTLGKTNEPCAAAVLIRAQGEQIESIDVLKYIMRKRGVNGESDASGQAAMGRGRKEKGIFKRIPGSEAQRSIDTRTDPEAPIGRNDTVSK